VSGVLLLQKEEKVNVLIIITQTQGNLFLISVITIATLRLTAMRAGGEFMGANGPWSEYI